MILSNPNLILYVCISKGATILAEFNTQDAALATLASKCLENTPPLHTTFSHTVRKRTHTFLIHDPLVYFAICDENLENSETLCFLGSVKEAFNEIVLRENVKFPVNLNSHCFQGEFNPVFHQLLSSPADFEVPPSPRELLKHGCSGSLDSLRGKRIGSVPLIGGGDTAPKSLKKKKKKRFSVETNGEGKDDRLAENKVDVSGDAIVTSRGFFSSSMSMQKNGLFVVGDSAHQKAKRVGRRHVWVVLSVDLIVCSILFGIWLWVCRGFKCIDG